MNDHGSTAELVLMLLADARLPSGGHTQSAGLEPALLGGMRPGDLDDYLRARLYTVTATSAAVSVVTLKAVRSGAGASVGAAAWLHWAARTPSQVMRATEEQLGRGYRRLLEHWCGPSDYLTEMSSQVSEYFGIDKPRPPRAVILGLIAAQSGLDAHQTTRLVGYDDVQTVVSAYLKLVPADPLRATSWAWGAFESIESMADVCAQVAGADDIPSLSAPQLEAWLQQHSTRRERLFSA